MSNAEQIEYWNGEAGATWVAQADALDLMLHDAGVAMLTRAALRLGDRAFDIGCGSGAVTFAAQECVGDVGQVTGLDISAPLIRNAQQRAQYGKSRAAFVEADAATWQSSFEADAIVSRFGVMFFDDPTAAFANILRLTKRGGTLTFACWRDPKASDMGTGLMKAAASLFVPPEVKPDPNAPGPFAFADQVRVTALLADAGWRDVNFDVWNGRLPVVGATTRESAEFLARMGPISRLMREQNVAVERVVEALIPFLEQRLDNGRVALNASAWIVSARR